MSTKRTIFWVGENAFESYKKTAGSVIKLFDNKILLFSRNRGTEVTEGTSLTFLNEYYPISAEDYSVHGMHEALAYYLNDRMGTKEEALFIGDPGEVLVQAVISGMAVTALKFQDVKEDIFEMAAFKGESEHFNFPDLSGCDLLLLSSVMPFSDDILKIADQRSISKKWFANVMECRSNRSSLDEFLFNYSDTSSEAIKCSENITKL